MSSRNRYKNSSVHRCLAKSVDNSKVLYSNFILVYFSNFSAIKAN